MEQTVDGKNILTVKPYTKNRKPKKLSLLPVIHKAIMEVIEENRKNEKIFGVKYDHSWDGYLMRYPDGKLISPNTLTNKFKTFVRKHNMKPIRFHDLRHSCASILYANGVDLKTIQEILGHVQISTTHYYTHMINDQQNDALIQMSKQIIGDADEKEDL